MTIIIKNKVLSFDDKLVKRFETLNGESFKEAVPYYLCVNSGVSSVNEAISGKSSKELEDIVVSAIEGEFQVCGVVWNE